MENLTCRVYLERVNSKHWLQALRPRVSTPFRDRPTRPKNEILRIGYAILLRVLYNFCYDLRWERLSQAILVHKFNLFPSRRRWQIEEWAAQFQRQNLFPNASDAELREMAKDLVMSFLI